MSHDMDGGAGRARVLVVEDDDRIRAALRLALGDEGYVVEDVADAEAAVDHFRVSRPDIVLVDVMLPGMSGLDLCHHLRRSSDVPIIIVTARDDSHDVVAGLEAGADDYVTKPFVVKELAARIRALLRRTSAPVSEPSRLRFGDLVVSVEEGTVTRGGDAINLTRTEFLLLCELIDNPRRVLSRDQLLSNVWGYDYYGDTRIVDAHIGRLRKKIEPDPSAPSFVTTVRGLGYKFVPGPG
jgi:DNA-binding response OmpR family regulator